MLRILASFACVLFAAAAPSLVHAQLLSGASDAVRGSSSSDDQSSSSSSSDDDDYDDDDYQGQDDGGGLLSSASDAVRGSSSSGGGGGGSSSYRGGRSRGRSSSGPPSGYVLAIHPYLGGQSGYSQPIVAPDGQQRDARTALRLDAELGYALGGAGRGGLGARLQLPFIVDLVVRYSFFLEPTEDGLQAAALGRFGVDLRLLDVSEAQVRIGGGIRHFQDALGGVFGGDAVVGLDLFPVEPLILSFEVGGGAVGQALVAVARGTIGFIVDGTEVYAGYHYEGLFAGGTQVDLGGPTLGVRAWL